MINDNLLQPACGGLRTSGYFKSTSTDRPLVSFVIATYNSANSLGVTIESIAAQDYSNFEIIVIDGGSDDESQNILKSYNHVVDYWVSELDFGISDAFNKGILLSRGEYINFQGAGDFLVSNSVLSKVMSGVFSGSYQLISARVKRISQFDVTNTLWIAPHKYSSSFNKFSLLFKMSLPHQGLLTNRLFFERYGLFDLESIYAMDYEHLLRAYNNFPAVKMVDVIFSAWREGGIGSNKTLEIFDEYRRIKLKNKVSNYFFLYLINEYIHLKYFIKLGLNKILSYTTWKKP